jgi:hypothetical protein
MEKHTKTFSEYSIHDRLKEFLSDRYPVYGSQVKRIGIARVLTGGTAMYICLPFIVLQHIFYLFFFYNVLLFHLIGLPRLKFTNYVVVDRYKIEALPWLDRFNCMYCGYANGLYMFWEAKVDQMHDIEYQNLDLVPKLIITALIILLLPFSLIYKALGYLIYDFIVASCMGLHRVSTRELYKSAIGDGVGKNAGLLVRAFLVNEMVEVSRLENSLEQIESAWCPFRHLDHRPEVVYPKHHGNLLGPDEVDKARDILQSDGSVSKRKPRI